MDEATSVALQERAKTPQADQACWTFLSNHAHVLVCLAREPNIRLRDVAALVGITERAVLKIVSELERGGVVTRKREGRRNRYTIHLGVQLRHILESNRNVGDLLSILVETQNHAANES